TTAFILKRSGDPQCSGVYVRAVAGLNEAAKCAALRDATRDSDCDWRYEASASNFTKIPGAPIAYWLSVEMLEAFSKGAPLATVSSPRNGLQTSDNGRFLRYWWETASSSTALPVSTDPIHHANARRFPYNKGGGYRRWYGNQIHVVNWSGGGAEIRHSLNERYPYLNGNLGALVRATDDYFKPHVSWSAVSSGTPAFREYPEGLVFDAAANSIFPESE